MHTGSGAFGLRLLEHGDRPAVNGSRYRATIIEPRVTPDVYWEGAAPGDYRRLPR